MWIEVQIYSSVNAKSRPGNMSQRYNNNIKRLKQKKSAPEYSAEGLGSSRKRCWVYTSIYENTPKKVMHLPPKSCQNFT